MRGGRCGRYTCIRPGLTLMILVHNNIMMQGPGVAKVVLALITMQWNARIDWFYPCVPLYRVLATWIFLYCASSTRLTLCMYEQCPQLGDFSRVLATYWGIYLPDHFYSNPLNTYRSQSSKNGQSQQHSSLTYEYSDHKSCHVNFTGKLAPRLL